MAMPEASLDLKDDLIFRQYNVRVSRQVANMQSKPKAEPVERLPDQHLRLRVLRSDAGHISGSRGNSFALGGFHVQTLVELSTIP